MASLNKRRTWLSTCFFVLSMLTLRAQDDTSLLQADLASSATASFLDLVEFHAESTVEGHVDPKTMHDILALVGVHARNLSDAGQRPAVVHVGGDVFQNPARWSDMHLHGEIQRALAQAGVPLHAYSLHIVEPRESTHEALRAKLKELGLTEEGDGDVTGALIMGKCAEPTVTMYGPSEILRKRHPFFSIIDSWSSMDPHHFHNVIHGLRDQRLKNMFQQTLAFTNAELVVMIEPDESKWVEPRQVKCLSSEGLLTSLRADARDVPMLVVDAEGADVGIVTEFLKLEAFAPTVIQFEGEYQRLRGGPLMEMLKSRGYAVGSLKIDSFSPDSENIYAVRLSGSGRQ